MRSFEEQAQETQSRLRLYIALAAAAALCLVPGALLLIPDGSRSSRRPPRRPSARHQPSREGPRHRRGPRWRRRHLPAPGAARVGVPGRGSPAASRRADAPDRQRCRRRIGLRGPAIPGETPITTTAVARHTPAQRVGGGATTGSSRPSRWASRRHRDRASASRGGEAERVDRGRAQARDGRCQGRLAADVAGLRYETGNKGDAFTLPWAQVEAFEGELPREEPQGEAARRQDLELHRRARQRRRAVRLPPGRHEGPAEAGRQGGPG